MKKNIGFKVTLLDIDSNRLLFVDELRFKQALTNIISNAFKFTKVGKVELRVVLDSEGKTISFDIIDTGVGIPESKFLTIFNSFEQVNKEDENEGFGLGLAITKNIVDLMKGELTVSSKLGKGTIFRLVFFQVTCLEKIRRIMLRREELKLTLNMISKRQQHSLWMT